MKHHIIAITALLFFSHSVFAADCYTPEQYRAEQALRFHTNLMVFGLYCKPVLRQDTYAAYQQFTNRNQNVVRNQENRLISYYQETKAASPERALHSFRTNLANDTSLQASKSIVTFCRNYTTAYNRAKAMKPVEFQHWIEQISLKYPRASSRKLCGAAQQGK